MVRKTRCLAAIRDRPACDAGLASPPLPLPRLLRPASLMPRHNATANAHRAFAHTERLIFPLRCPDSVKPEHQVAGVGVLSKRVVVGYRCTRCGERMGFELP